MAMMGIDTILQHLANASGALERTSRPGIKEVKEAAGSAKIAADLLKASEVFLSNGIYVICDEPACAYVDPAAHKIEMPEVTHIELDEPAPAPELSPLPALFAEDFLEETPEGQKVAFESALEDLEEKVFEANPDISSWDDALWWAAFDADPLAAWKKLMFSIHHREAANFDVPTDEEFAAWRAGFAPDAPEEVPQEEAAPEAVPEAAADPKAGLKAFQDLLEELEERGVESGQKRKNWEKVNTAWWKAYDANPLGTFSKLQALIDRNGCTWDIPEDEIENEEAI